MAKIFKTPGVYIQEVPALPPSIAQVETSIPVFIGYTQKANDINGTALVPELINGIAVYPAQRIDSLVAYESMFGMDTLQSLQINENYADDKVTLLDRLVIINTPAVPSLHNHLQLFWANGGGACYIVSIGNTADALTKNGLLAGLEMASRYDDPALVVIPPVSQLSSAADYGEVCNAALQQAATLGDRFVLLDCYADNSDMLRSNTGTANLAYGAAYHPYLKVSYSCYFDPQTVAIKLQKSYTDGSEELTDVNFAELTADVQTLVKTAVENATILVPPSGAVAGTYTRADSTNGVWKAPANEALTQVIGLTQTITDAQQDALNVDPVTGKSINAIRSFTGRGILVWGARTLAGNDNNWRYISVRRFFIMVEESIKKATQPFVFEPNDANTWVKIRAMITNYLTQLWRSGAMPGSKPEQAFFVNVGLGTTMTAQDVLNGNLIIEIGMAVVRPAEFVIIRITQLMQQS